MQRREAAQAQRILESARGTRAPQRAAFEQAREPRARLGLSRRRASHHEPRIDRRKIAAEGLEAQRRGAQQPVLELREIVQQQRGRVRRSQRWR
jgi:hypothetical protein